MAENLANLREVAPDDLRLAMRSFASGVCVVTSRDQGGEPVGMTVSSFCSVSLQPPLVLVCLFRETQTAQAVAAMRQFGVSILASDQEHVSRQFAMRGADRFRGVGWSAGRTGVPLVEGAVVHLEAAVEALLPGGTHDIVVGRVMATRRVPGRPLLYFDGDYRKLCENGR